MLASAMVLLIIDLFVSLCVCQNTIDEMNRAIDFLDFPPSKNNNIY